MPQDVVHALRHRVGTHVRRLRQSRGLSQEGLAELAGNTGKHIGQVERGEVSVGLDILGAIARALSIDPSDLLAPRRRRSDPAYLASERQVQGLEELARRLRAARVNVSDLGPR
jgi:transcriptional regulator with XRE-family HTH domain